MERRSRNRSISAMAFVIPAFASLASLRLQGNLTGKCQEIAAKRMQFNNSEKERCRDPFAALMIVPAPSGLKAGASGGRADRHLADGQSAERVFEQERSPSSKSEAFERN